MTSQKSTIAGYSLSELVRDSGAIRVFRGRRLKDGLPVVLKVSSARRRSPRDVARLRNELEIARTFDDRFVIQPHELVSEAGTWALVLDDVGGTPLACLLGEPMPIERFLTLAIRIASALAEVHGRGVVHRDLKPHNIIVRPATDEVWLTDFGFAAMLARTPPPIEKTPPLEVSLGYMAPEQTGRMSRAPDFRADLYALGVTFYEMLTGTLPFLATDPVGWVHSHIAREPKAPSAVRADVPPALSSIVMKLLRKDTEDRYQSAYGLAWDLEKALVQWRAEGQITTFALGERDALDTFRVPRRLYGRERELASLVDAFERVVRKARAELVLVSGYVGTGKTSVVKELQNLVTRPYAFFVRGKFDQYQRDIPYATIAQAVRELVSLLLGESDESLRSWRAQMRAALGANGQLILDMIPEVERIIGPQTPVPPLSPAEAELRLADVFDRFLRVFATREHTLVLFIDDLQWLDVASLRLMSSLLAEPEGKCLLLIAAYRDNEIGSNPALKAALQSLRGQDVRVVEIALAPLRVDDMDEMLAQSLHATMARVRPLSLSMLRKTGGNPFFVKQLVIRLHLDGLIWFDRETATWWWDLDAIDASAVTENVVDLMARRLRELDGCTLSALQIAACLGSTFDTRTLAIAWGRTPSESFTALRAAIESEMVVVVGAADPARTATGELSEDVRLSFGHDRIQQAAYATIPDAEKKPLHLKIGRALLGAAAEADRREDAMFIADQWNRALDLVHDPDERVAVAELDFTAANKARSSAAYASARCLMAAARRCAGEELWETRYPFMFALQRESVEIEGVTGNLELAEELAWRAMARARSVFDRVELYKLLIEQRTMIPDYPGATRLGRDALSQLGVSLPSEGIAQLGVEEIEAVRAELGRREIASLVDLPVASDARTRAIATVLAKLINTSYQCDADLWQLITTKLVRLSLVHGNTPESVFAYAAFGNLLGSRFGEYRAGRELCLLGLELSERFSDLAQKCVVREILVGHVNHWSRHLRTSSALAAEGYRAGVEAGYVQYASYTNAWQMQATFYQGVDLSSVLSECAPLLLFAARAREGVSLAMLRAVRAAAVSLCGSRESGHSLDTEGLSEQAFVDECKRTRNKLALCLFYVHKEMVLFIQIQGEPGPADQAAQAAEQLLPQFSGTIAAAEHVFYRSLIDAALFAGATSAGKAALLARIEANQDGMRRWADNCPDNFRNKLLLVEAELCRITGREVDAMQLYRDAIEAARRSEFVHEEALGYELAAGFYRKRGFDEIADHHLGRARACYARWGASAKVRTLEPQHLSFLSGALYGPASTRVLDCEHLDLLAIARASQSVSREIALPRVREALLRTVVEHAGAERGVLVAVQGEAFLIQARAAIEGSEIKVEAHDGARPLDGEVPVSILRFVRRTRELLLLGDASAAPAYAADPYVARVRPRSILCVPIERHAEIVAILYLENRLTVSAFAQGSVVAIEILAAQAAISLENASLYSSLEASQQKLQAILDNTPVLIYMKDTEGRFLLANRRIESILGLRGPEIIGKTDHEIFPKEHADVFRAHDIHVMTRGAPIEVEEMVPQGDGLHAYLSFKFPIRDRDNVIYAVCSISTDMTERKGAESERAQAIEREQAALASREEFLTLAAHELRTPLTPIKLYLGALRLKVAGSGSQEMKRFLTKVVEKVDRLEALTEALLDYARVSEGKLGLQLERLDLAALVREVVAGFRDALATVGYTLRLELDQPVVGRWDRCRLQQVVVHLLSNAIKYGAGKPIEIRVARAASLATLTIQDHGVGIDYERQTEVFERFNRGASVLSYGGFGLGLFLSRKIVEAHGGQLNLRSAPSAGTVFQVELPVVDPEDSVRDGGEVASYGAEQGSSSTNDVYPRDR